MSVVCFQHVHKAFGKQQVLRGVNFEIPDQKITFIIGRSGEGKSVTLKHIVGILIPDEGDIFVDGKNMVHASKKEWIETRKKVGLLFQDGALFDSMSVEENVVFALKEFGHFSKKELKMKATELLSLVGLSHIEEYMPSQLSIGEKKRVGLARALSLQPKVLLYDEPTTSMDPLVSDLIDKLIVDTQKKIEGITSVVISHDMNSVLKVAEYIIFLHEGKVYFAGDAKTFKESEDPVIHQFVSGSKEGPLSKIIA